MSRSINSSAPQPTCSTTVNRHTQRGSSC
jgi:hypothetical protein